MARHYGWAMVSFTPVILLMTQLAAPVDPGVLVSRTRRWRRLWAP